MDVKESETGRSGDGDAMIGQDGSESERDGEARCLRARLYDRCVAMISERVDRQTNTARLITATPGPMRCRTD